MRLLPNRSCGVNSGKLPSGFQDSTKKCREMLRYVALSRILPCSGLDDPTRSCYHPSLRLRMALKAGHKAAMWITYT